MCSRGDGDEELFGTASAVSGGESDADDKDHFPDGGAGDQDRHRVFVRPQPLRRLNWDSIYGSSSMTAQLTAKKKGLSRYYVGRSQSFACMSEVQCLEDLQKDNPYRQKTSKACKSHAALRGMAKTARPSSNSCADLNVVATNAPPIRVNRNGYHQ